MLVVIYRLKEDVGSKLSGFLIELTWNWTVSPGKKLDLYGSEGTIRTKRLPWIMVQASIYCKRRIPVH